MSSQRNYWKYRKHVSKRESWSVGVGEGRLGRLGWQKECNCLPLKCIFSLDTENLLEHFVLVQVVTKFVHTWVLERRWRFQKPWRWWWLLVWLGVSVIVLTGSQSDSPCWESVWYPSLGASVRALTGSQCDSPMDSACHYLWDAYDV